MEKTNLCPYCGGELKENEGKLICAECGKLFGLARDGVNPDIAGYKDENAGPYIEHHKMKLSMYNCASAIVVIGILLAIFTMFTGIFIWDCGFEAGIVIGVLLTLVIVVATWVANRIFRALGDVLELQLEDKEKDKK